MDKQQKERIEAAVASVQPAIDYLKKCGQDRRDKMKTIEKLLQEYHSRQSNLVLRFNQWFCNNFIDEPWPALYYEEDIVMAIRKISTWLTVNGYERKMPKRVQTEEDFYE